jgi:cell division protease FtsH
MVTEYGMSKELGPVSYGGEHSDVFLGRDLVSRKDYSEQKAREIDDEVAHILSEKYEEARVLLTDNRELLDTVTEALLERETLEGPQLQLLLRGEPLPELKSTESEDSSASAQPTRGERDEDLAGDKTGGTTGGKTGGNIPDPEPMPS